MSSTEQSLSCFKAYDIRGKLGEELNADIAYRIGRAFGQHLKPKSVVVGGDVRLTSEELKASLAEGLMDAGADVIDIGMTGTEEIYFATQHLGVDGGIEVTASHNPMNYNGMKLVREDAKPISGDTGLKDIKALAERNEFDPVDKAHRGTLMKQSNLDAYADCLMSYIQPENIKPLKLVVNSGNGAAGHVIDELEERFSALQVPVEFIKVHHQPDGNFPNGIPNPLLPECREDTAKAVREHKADMGIAWDGDFDRCFLFDENGEFVEGYYIVGMLAEAFLKKYPQQKIIHDPRVYWNTDEVVKANNGIPVMSKTGHAFIKERMRQEDAVYGGEMSAHHYFRDFAYCDSGMIPWLLVAELLSVTNMTLSEMVKSRIAAFPSSGEINLKLGNPKQAIARVEEHYKPLASVVDHTDGLSMEFVKDDSAWRFNLRSSNTELVVRLNVESKGDTELVIVKVEELKGLLK
jgi:phosphomannomutase